MALNGVEELIARDLPSLPIDRVILDLLRRAKLANEVQPQPATAWFEVPTGTLVLTPPPTFVSTRGISQRRVVMTRVSPEDYEKLVAARSKTNPTEEDLEKLDELIDEVIDD